MSLQFATRYSNDFTYRLVSGRAQSFCGGGLFWQEARIRPTIFTGTLSRRE